MKKLVLLIYLVVLSNGYCYTRTLSIDSISRILINSVNHNDKEQFIRFFPTSKQTFVAIFGFYDKGFRYDNIWDNTFENAAVAPLYDNSHYCISFLFDSICNNPKEWNLYKNVLIPTFVKLAIEIYNWEADAVNDLQIGITQLLLSDVDMWEYVDNLYKADQKSFFHFIFDSPISHTNEYKYLLQKTESRTCKKSTKRTMKKIYNELHRTDRR